MGVVNVTWRTPRTWADGEAVLPWHFRTDLRDNVRFLRKQQEASISLYIPAGNDFSLQKDRIEPIPWQATNWNYGGLARATGSRVTTLTIPVTGLYEVWCVVEWNISATNNRDIWLILNDAASDLPRVRMEPNDSGLKTVINYYAQFLFVEGDEVELAAQHDTDDAPDLNSGIESSRAGVNLVGLTMDSPPSWTTPRTWTDTEVPTAALFNAHIRDNLINLRHCRGVACLVKKTADQTLSNNVNTDVTWGTALLNMGSVWSAGSPTLFTAPVAGWYLAWASMAWNPNANGPCSTLFETSVGGQWNGRTVQPLSDSVKGVHYTVYTELPLQASETLKVVAKQRSGGKLALRAIPTRAGLVLLGD